MRNSRDVGDMEAYTFSKSNFMCQMRRLFTQSIHVYSFIFGEINFAKVSLNSRFSDCEFIAIANVQRLDR